MSQSQRAEGCGEHGPEEVRWSDCCKTQGAGTGVSVSCPSGVLHGSDWCLANSMTYGDSRVVGMQQTVYLSKSERIAFTDRNRHRATPYLKKPKEKQYG